MPVVELRAVGAVAVAGERGSLQSGARDVGQAESDALAPSHRFTSVGVGGVAWLL